jgi:diaminopimelate decarboxylase
LPTSNNLTQTTRLPFSLYFLKGNDQRLLSPAQAGEIDRIVANNQLQTSCLLYNSTEAMRKFDDWGKSLPWIKAHYAIKSNPALPLLNDLQARGSGYDCASRAELEAVMDVGARR